MLVLSRMQLDLRRLFAFRATRRHTHLRNLLEITAATVCRDNAQLTICETCGLEFGTCLDVVSVNETFLQSPVAQGSQRREPL